jgi:hypothetical protein
MCQHTLDDAGLLLCTREAHPENPGGHVYVSSTGSDLDDRHGEVGHG